METFKSLWGMVMPITALLKSPDESITYESTLKDITYRHKMIEFGFSKNEDKDREELEELLSFSYDNYCEVVCEIPGNELRKAYTQQELGFKIVAMPLKENSGDKQYADYAFKISINGEPYKYLKIRFERKEMSDFNLTILNHWKRFKKELANSKDEDFRIVVESNMIPALTYFYPYPKKCKYCKNVGFKLKDKTRAYYCKNDGKPVKPLGTCLKVAVKQRSDKKIGQLISFKRKRIGIIEAMGFPIVWAGNRFNAAQYINTSVKQFFIVNYAEVLDL